MCRASRLPGGWFLHGARATRACQASDIRPCKPHPFRHRPASRRCGSARCFSRSTSAKPCVGETGKSMKAVELAVCLLKFWQGGCHGQPSAAKLGSQNCRDPDYHPTKSRLGFPVPVGGKGSLRELHPDFEQMYLHHFAEPEEAFDKMRDSLLDCGRELADIAGRLRGESSG
jgi:hypothetical protein